MATQHLSESVTRPTVAPMRALQHLSSTNEAEALLDLLSWVEYAREFICQVDSAQRLDPAAAPLFQRWEIAGPPEWQREESEGLIYVLRRVYSLAGQQSATHVGEQQ